MRIKNCNVYYIITSSERKIRRQMAEKYNVYGMWDKVRLFCYNHETPEPMEIVQNNEYIRTAFFACRDYINREEGKHNCANRLNMDDYEGIVLKVLDMYAEDPLTPLTGREFTYRGARQKIFVRILKETDGHIDVGIKNLTVLKK